MSADRFVHVLLSSTDNESTQYPWWGIVKRAGLGQYAMLAGPFFSRASAERQRKARIYEYGERSLVYCFSGHESRDFRDLMDAAREAERNG
jgi:hypothetical protein